MILARFADADRMDEAARRLAQAGVAGVESYGPTPPDGPGRSLVPPVMLALGLLAGVGTFAMQAYATTIGYRLDIGGRPDLFWPAYLPFSIEAAMLFAMVGGFLGFLVAARLPALYDPVDEGTGFAAASRDAWFLSIPAAPDEATRAMLGDATIEDLPE